MSWYSERAVSNEDSLYVSCLKLKKSRKSKAKVQIINYFFLSLQILFLKEKENIFERNLSKLNQK